LSLLNKRSLIPLFNSLQNLSFCRPITCR